MLPLGVACVSLVGKSRYPYPYCNARARASVVSLLSAHQSADKRQLQSTRVKKDVCQQELTLMSAMHMHNIHCRRIYASIISSSFPGQVWTRSSNHPKKNIYRKPCGQKSSPERSSVTPTNHCISQKRLASGAGMSRRHGTLAIRALLRFPSKLVWQLGILTRKKRRMPIERSAARRAHISAKRCSATAPRHAELEWRRHIATEGGVRRSG